MWAHSCAFESASKRLSSTIRKVLARRKHRVTDVIWLKLDPELSERRMQPFTSVGNLLDVQLTEFQPFSSRLTHSLVLVPPSFYFLLFSLSMIFIVWLLNIPSSFLLIFHDLCASAFLQGSSNEFHKFCIDSIWSRVPFTFLVHRQTESIKNLFEATHIN